MTTSPDKSVTDRITEYLASGGLFNPELANHEAVRDLLIDARDALTASGERVAALEAALNNIASGHASLPGYGIAEAAAEARSVLS